MIHDFEQQYWVLQKAADPSLQVPLNRNHFARVARQLAGRGLILRGGRKNSAYTLTAEGAETLKAFRQADAKLTRARRAIEAVIVRAAA